MAKPQTGHKNSKVGEVVSSGASKTIVVAVTRRVAHPLYRRIVSRKKRFHAHDENQEASVGDRVKISECRPLSKLKRWQLDEIVLRAKQVDLTSK